MYQILSPDGFPISQDIYRNKKQAKLAFEKWKQSFYLQGFYSQLCYNGYKREIPLNQLEDYCQLIKL